MKKVQGYINTRYKIYRYKDTNVQKFKDKKIQNAYLGSSVTILAITCGGISGLLSALKQITGWVQYSVGQKRETWDLRCELILVRNYFLGFQDLFISGDVDEVMSRGALHQLKWCQVREDVITGGQNAFVCVKSKLPLSFPFWEMSLKEPCGCHLGTWNERSARTSPSMDGLIPSVCPLFTRCCQSFTRNGPSPKIANKINITSARLGCFILSE